MAIEMNVSAASSANAPTGRGEFSAQFTAAKAVAKEVGALILRLRTAHLGLKEIVLENGKKMVQTDADVKASAQIINELSKIYPKHGFVSQDQLAKAGSWYTQEYVWIINPIDNTVEFEKGKDDFHVQIGLVHENEAVLGISYYPAKNMFIYAICGQGAWKEVDGTLERLVAKPCAKNILLKSSSQALIEPILDKQYEVVDKHLSSTSRLLEIINGNASLYVSLGASPQGKDKKGGIWNYGANALIAKEAGVELMTLRGNPLNLRDPSALLTEGVIVTTDLQAAAHLVKHFKSHW
jgi:3'-phosphoadenosine 5'-phosphosulfate (PAPS) 3'-phosphatase